MTFYWCSIVSVTSAPDSNSGGYVSMPLAEAQRHAAQPTLPQMPEPEPDVRADPEPHQDDALTGDLVRPVPTIDYDFDRLPEQTFEDFAFRLGPVTGNIVYVLGIDDDNTLVDMIDEFQDDASLADIIDIFFETTFRYALRPDGTEVANSRKYFFDVISSKPKSGKLVPRKMLMDVMNDAIEKWSAELTDTSMRPNRRARRTRRR